jgi:hypothetical protein
MEATNEITAQVDRRRLLRRAIATAAVGTAGITLLDQGRASAATGDPILAGQATSANHYTTLSCSDTHSALWVLGQGSSGISYTAAVLGDSNASDGVAGVTSATGKNGVYGQSTNGIGVHGQSDSATGVLGFSGSWWGASGFSNTDTGGWFQSYAADRVGLRGVAHAQSSFSYTAGVVGESDVQNGVAGITTGNGQVGVFGLSHGMDAWGQHPAGVAGHSDVNPGVMGQSTSNDGVTGLSTSGNGVSGQSSYIGVRGYSQGGVGVGGNTASGKGVSGVVDGPGTGVYAEGSGGGTALRVNGVAKFSRSGIATVTSGHSKVVISHVALTSGSAVIATLQHVASGNAVSSAVPSVSASTITINLLKNASANFRVAWFVIG